MGLAESNLKRDEEAEETLVSAISVFKGRRIKTCLQKLYAETDDTIESGESPPPRCPQVVLSASPHPLILHGPLPPLSPPAPAPYSTII